MLENQSEQGMKIRFFYKGFEQSSRKVWGVELLVFRTIQGLSFMAFIWIFLAGRKNGRDCGDFAGLCGP